MMIQNDDPEDVFVERARDYCRDILLSTLGSEYAMSASEAERLDLILNRYHADTTDKQLKRHREARSKAPALLKALDGSLRETSRGLSELSRNHYASSAVFATLPSQLGDKPLDTLIGEFNDLCSGTEMLSAILAAAEEQQQYSNGLPSPNRGAPSDPEFDHLVSTLASAVRDVVREGSKRRSGSARLVEPTRDEVASHLHEILKIGGFDISQKALYNRL